MQTSNMNSFVYHNPQNTCNLNNTLFVGNLHASLQEIDLIQVFRPFGRIVECCKKWLHFGFVKFTTEEEACHAYVTLNGFRLKGRPMRLEFQNRTKKARIKAILAQASLQATTNSLYCTEMPSFNINNDYTNFMDERSANLMPNSFTNNYCFQQNNFSLSQMSEQTAGAVEKKDAFDFTFFNPEELIKFATETEPEREAPVEIKCELADFDYNDFKKPTNVFEKVSKFIEGKDYLCTSEELFWQFPKSSPSLSPNHDISSSLSCDSGCRSASFSNEEDSGMCSLKINVNNVTSLNNNNSNNSNSQLDKNKKMDYMTCNFVSQEVTISEHLEFTCSKNVEKSNDLNINEHVLKNENDEHDQDDEDDSVSNCDTSDDASEIPADSDCLNDLDFMDEANLQSDCNIVEFNEINRYNQVIEKDGTLMRKKLEHGIYCSVNRTFSLFIEPHDVLKYLEPDEFREYSLFPSEIQTAEMLMLKNQLFMV